jgi:hypothetical protein
MTVRRLTRSTALGLALAAVAAPTAAAQQDLRNPDTRDAARSSQQAPADSLSQDLRSPDTRDAAEGRGTIHSPEVTVIKVPQASPTPDAGLDWGDTGIGAAGMLGLILLGLGAALTVTHRRQGPRRQTATSG